jgi:hypothetical protein
LQALAADRARLEQRVAKVAEQEAEVTQARREVELARAELADSRMEQERVEAELQVSWLVTYIPYSARTLQNSAHCAFFCILVEQPIDISNAHMCIA